MKNSSKMILAGVVVVVGLAITYRAVNKTPDPSLPANEQMAQILNDGGCIFCHSSNPDLPFYASWPVAKSMIKAHVDKGYQMFDITPMMEAIGNNEAVNEVDLAKVERCVIEGSMPLAAYYLVHWGSSLTDAKNDLLLGWVEQHRSTFYPNPLAAEAFRNEPIRPIPDALDVNMDKVQLGTELYHDTRLSGDGTISCASCHSIQMAGVDNHQYSDGINGQLGGINAPTSFNSVFNFVQFWDGRAATLADQAAGPPLNPGEMGASSFEEIAGRLAADVDFSKRFLAVYPEGMNQQSITDAIAEYEKTLLTPNSAFDRYLKGDLKAMSDEQIAGYALFKEYKCATCHAGINMGGLSYELMGQRSNYFQDREINVKSGLTDADNGRWAQTQVERDRYRFKTPTLRNVALTWPYYHDGSVDTLEKAIEMMATYQVGRSISEGEIAQIKAFLDAQTGEYEGKLLTNINKQE